MFLTELSPLMREFLGQPIAFAGGIVTGVLRLSPETEPVKSWLAKQGISMATPDAERQPTSGPQSITID